ncbi:MAG: ATP-binding protein, partial [bacterium]
QAESAEKDAFRKNLEQRATQERERMEGEIVAAKAETEGVRGELETTRAERGALADQVGERDRWIAERDEGIVVRDQAIAARDQAIVERDQTILALNDQATQFQASLTQLQQQLDGQAVALAEMQKELESRPKGPAGGFVLFSEASEALAVELSGLLEIVQGYTSQMIEAAGGAISEEQQEFLTTVINRSAKSQRLMGDLRDFSGVVKPDGLAKDPVDLAALLQDTVSTVQQTAEDRGIEFSGDVPATLPELIGDEARLRQLFTVILQQAVRFTPEGGRVVLTVLQKTGVAGVRIEDGADPIPLGSDEVFGHFHGSDEEVLETRGSGLKFPILRAIAMGHGGAIDLAINEQGGNLFFVRLPVREGAPTAQATAGLFGMGEGAATEEPVAAAESLEAFPPSLEAAPDLSAASPETLPPAEPGLAFDLSGLDAFAAAPPAEPAPSPLEGPPAVDTTDSIMAAAPDASPALSSGEGPGEPLWDVPSSAAPPTLESIEAAPLEAAPLDVPPLEGLSFSLEGGLPGADLAASAGEPAPSASASEATPQDPAAAPPSAFSFGSDEIIQE